MKKYRMQELSDKIYYENDNLFKPMINTHRSPQTSFFDRLETGKKKIEEKNQ